MANGREVPEALSSHDHSRPTFPRKVTPPERKALPLPPATAERLGSTGNPSPARRLPQSLLDYKHQAEITPTPATRLSIHSEDSTTSPGKAVSSCICLR
ncbi:hypothetical protein BKA56DRAFT_606201 [Ilyonectria sp. MPI-CAGE-AT-0026]|nr:hypothetical protein BKA56DRAFT_606201 [Ilyonectria sp. MPI-CAGE-AT-0026]